jgi:hypothetical protein
VRAKEREADPILAAAAREAQGLQRPNAIVYLSTCFDIGRIILRRSILTRKKLNEIPQNSHENT